jgi:sugar/nucleoside kinase (ribokinase family)
MGPTNFLEWTRGFAICFPNSDEAAVLTGHSDHAAQLSELARHYPLVVVKRGSEGCEAASGSNHWREPAPLAKVIDTTGAGDAFVAAFLAARLGCASLQECLRRAVTAGALATETVGGGPPSA